MKKTISMYSLQISPKILAVVPNRDSFTFTNFDKTAEIATSCASQYFNAAAIKTLHKPKYAIGYPSGNLVSRVYSFS